MTQEKKNVQLDNKKVFFTKKKIILFSIALLIFIIFIVLVSKFFFDINFNIIETLFRKSYQQNSLFFLWLILLVCFPVYNCLSRVFPYIYKLRKKRIFIEWYNWIIFCLVTFFIGAITPFAMGYEPYVIYWLKKNGLSLKESTALVASFTVLNPLIQVIITWPSFFILCAQYNSYSSDIKWVIAFWSVFVGLMIDLIGTCFWWLMSCSKNVHYVINLIINWFKKICRMKYKTKEEIKYEYKENAGFKKIFFKELKDWKFIVMILLSGLIWNMLYYSSMIFAFNLMDPGYGFNAGELFNYTNVATTANNFIPIPGAEGTLQATLSIFIQASNSDQFNDKNLLSEICNNSVFIWRTFTFYSTAILGLGAMIILIIKELYKFIIKKRKQKLNIDNYRFGIIILIDNIDLQKIEDTLLMLSKNLYNLELINLYIITKNSFTKQQKELIKNNLKDLHYEIYRIAKWNNLFEIIKFLNSKNKLNVDYCNFINQGDIIDLDIFNNINGVLHQYDIYATQYRRKTNQNHYNKISPFWFLYKKRFKDHKKILSPYFNPFSFFIKKDILIKAMNKYQFEDSLYLYFYSLILKQVHSLRYLRKFSGYKNRIINNILDSNDILALRKVIKNNDQELYLNHISKQFKPILIKHKVEFNRKFNFNWLPWYLRFLFNFKYNHKFRKIIKNN